MSRIDEPCVSPNRLWIVAAALAACVVLSLMLALEHAAGVGLPGCGPESACDTAARSVWGKIPVIGLPVSIIGTAFFALLLAVWLRGGGHVDTLLRWLARSGAVVSVGYLAIIVIGQHYCAYCIAAHIFNLIAWALIERSKCTDSVRSSGWGLGAAVGVVVFATLTIVDLRGRSAAADRAAQDQAESTRKIIEATSQKSPPAARATTTSAPIGPTTTASASIAANATVPAPPAGGFTGRWRLGPERAPIRIVVCSDYQCPACKQVETELRAIHKARPDVSISMKHYPVCADCNRYMPRTMHPNACWAARAAETAGILRGNDAFWEMHFALFDRGGSFTNPQLVELVKSMNYNPDEFQRMMKSDEPLNRIKRDIDDAMAIGMRYTPLVMINGVEFRGWETIGAITRAVEQIAATNPPALGAEADQPPAAADRLIAEWRKEPPRNLPEAGVWWIGPPDAPIRIVMFADYQEPTVARADRAIRDEMQRRGNIRYGVVRYPFCKDCNPTVQRTVHAQGCWAARAAIAAGRLRGAEGYWRVHDWLLANQTALNDAALLAATASLGFERLELQAEMQKPEVAQQILSECHAGKAIGLSSIPTIYVNGKLVAMWDYYGQNILTKIIDATAAP